jgi:hypothetical protein
MVWSCAAVSCFVAEIDSAESTSDKQMGICPLWYYSIQLGKAKPFTEDLVVKESMRTGGLRLCLIFKFYR